MQQAVPNPCVCVQALDEPVNGRVYRQIAQDIQPFLLPKPRSRTFSVKV